MVPFPEPEHFDNLRNCLEPKDFLKRARSLMVVVSTPPTQNYEEFTKKVREYSSKEPFNFVIPELLRKYEKVEGDQIFRIFFVERIDLFQFFVVPVRVDPRRVSLRFREIVRESPGSTSQGSAGAHSRGDREQWHPDHRDDYQKSHVSE